VRGWVRFVSFEERFLRRWCCILVILSFELYVQRLAVAFYCK